MYGRELDVDQYTAIRAERVAEMGLPELAAARGLDPSYRPRRSALEARLWFLSRIDLGTHNKGLLGGWGIDQRDPTADRRLIEYCLALPMEAYVSNGSIRALARAALADRVPAVVLDERRKGYQAVDWHEGFAAARGELADEVRRLESCGAAAATIDLQRLRTLLDAWPEKSRADGDVTATYRNALLRGISAGHFLRKSSGANT
jgi:asparagine synthase (glutamine-hydrolysing)